MIINEANMEPADVEDIFSDTNSLFRGSEPPINPINPRDYLCCLKFSPTQYILAFICLGSYEGSVIAQALTDKHVNTGIVASTGTIVVSSIIAFGAAFEVCGQTVVERMDKTWVILASRKLPSEWRGADTTIHSEWPALSRGRECISFVSAMSGTLFLSYTTAVSSNLFLNNLAVDYRNFPFNPVGTFWKSMVIIIPTGIAITNLFARFSPLYGGIRRTLSDEPFDYSWRNIIRNSFGSIIGFVNMSKIASQVYDVIRNKYDIDNNSDGNYALVGSLVIISPLLIKNGYINGSEGLNRILHTKWDDLNFKRIVSFLASVSAGVYVGSPLYYLYRAFLYSIANAYDHNNDSDNYLLNYTAAIFAFNHAVEISTALHIGSYALATTVEKGAKSLLRKFSCFSERSSPRRDVEIDVNTPLINLEPEESASRPNRCGIM